MVDGSMVSRGGMDYWGMVDRGGMDYWGMVGRGGMNNWCMISRGSMDKWGCVDSSILRSTIIGDISNITSIIISMVADSLSTTIRKSHSVGSFNITIAISRFSSIVVGTGVVIMHSVLVGVGGGNLLVHWGSMD